MEDIKAYIHAKSVPGKSSMQECYVAPTQNAEKAENRLLDRILSVGRDGNKNKHSESNVDDKPGH